MLQSHDLSLVFSCTDTGLRTKHPLVRWSEMFTFITINIWNAVSIFYHAIQHHSNTMMLLKIMLKYGWKAKWVLYETLEYSTEVCVKLHCNLVQLKKANCMAKWLTWTFYSASNSLIFHILLLLCCGLLKLSINHRFESCIIDFFLYKTF